MQRVIEIDMPMERDGKTTEALEPYLDAGWRVVHMAEVRALSPVNLQSITSAIVVVIEHE